MIINDIFSINGQFKRRLESQFELSIIYSNFKLIKLTNLKFINVKFTIVSRRLKLNACDYNILFINGN